MIQSRARLIAYEFSPYAAWPPNRIHRFAGVQLTYALNVAPVFI